jgi:hypothetical protein
LRYSSALLPKSFERPGPKSVSPATALDKIEALHPQAVVAGHGVLHPDSSPHHIDKTRRYIRDFNDSLAKSSTHLELYEKMLSLHPNRVNPGSLWAAAKAAKPL